MVVDEINISLFLMNIFKKLWRKLFLNLLDFLYNNSKKGVIMFWLKMIMR